MDQITGNWHYKHSELKCTVREMYDPLKWFPHQAFKVASHENISFGRLSNEPGEHKNFPVYLPEHSILFTAQGRLDNKVSLSAQLGIKADQPHTDNLIILQAYLKWGKDCVHQLRGNWSFAVFDFKEQTLFLARDPMGYTSLYYHQNETGFYFSSSIKSLLNLKTYNKQLNELHLIRNLTLWDDNQTEEDTYFKNIFSLPPAHTIAIKDKHSTVQKYWNPQQIPLKNYKNKQQYVQEMLEIFTKAVRSRLNDNGPVASMLSGGLDSSAVSYVAADLLKGQNKPLTTFSHVPLFEKELLDTLKSNTRILNEAPLINRVVEASGNMRPVLLNSQRYSVLKGMTDGFDILGGPSHASCNLYWMLDIFQTAREQGISTLLSGEGGNGSISFTGVDYLLPFSFSRLQKHPYLFLKNQVAKPIAKKYFNYYLNKRNYRKNNSLTQYVSDIFATQHILDNYHILKDIIENDKGFTLPFRDVRESKELFVDLYFSRSLFGAASSHYFGFNLSDPTTDVDLMEYFFSIPNEVFFDDYYNNRMLVKQMMSGKVPDAVLFEKRKGLQSADIVYRSKAQAEELWEAILKVGNSVAASHYIDTKGLAESWQLYMKQPYVSPYQMQCLLKALQFALFLQINFD
jgi:asparagine synthase (glutamine-hydrolysing)